MHNYELHAYAIEIDRLYSLWRYKENGIATLTGVL